MIILGIDTSTSVTSVAVTDGARWATAESPHGGRGADVLVHVDRACRELGIAPAALAAVAIGAGPGSFTGLRIGMASAKGIAFAADRPLWAVSSLAALAYADPALAGDAVVCAALDARRGEVYAGVYRRAAEHGLAALVAERTIAPAELAAWAATLGATRFTGDALAAYPDLLAPLTTAWRHGTPTGQSVAQLALLGARADVLVTGTPTYIRPSEAEVMYPDGVPGALRSR